MRFLTELLGRPESEAAVLPKSDWHPAEDCVVPDPKRKGLHEVIVTIGT
jgi:hypothetical protein